MDEFQVELGRVGHLIPLVSLRIQETLQSGSCTFISDKFYNKGIYRVRNKQSGALENFAIRIYRIEAATYQGLVDELGAECIDTSLWRNVPEGAPVFFYAFKLENRLVKNAPKKENEALRVKA